jgi:cell division protein FtsQ
VSGSARERAAHSPWRWSRRLALAALVAATLIVAGQWVLHRSYFSVRDVSVRIHSVGAPHESDTALIEAAGLASHPAMIDVQTSRIARRLEERFPWVQRAVVLMRWPHSVSITVTERTAVAVARDDAGHLVLVDGTGRWLGRTGPTGQYPLLVAIGRHGGAWPFSHWARPAAFVAARLPAAFAAQVAAVRVNRAGDLSLVMTTPVTFQLGDSSQLHQKFVAVASVIAHPLLLHAGDRVDVSVPSTPTVSGP